MRGRGVGVRGCNKGGVKLGERIGSAGPLRGTGFRRGWNAREPSVQSKKAKKYHRGTIGGVIDETVVQAQSDLAQKKDL